MKQNLQPLAWGMAMASIVAVASGFALSMVASTAQAAMAHDHGQHDQAAVIEPRPGVRWSTDEALREGMTRIHQAVQRSLPDAPGQPIGDQAAAELQRGIGGFRQLAVGDEVAGRRLDVALHGLLIDLLRGAEALSEADQREQGLQRLVDALERYPQLFAEPLWRDGFVARLH